MWKKDLTKFKKEMERKLQAQISEKGIPERSECRNFDFDYLKRKAREHLLAGNYADAANFCYLLWNGTREQ